MVIMYPHDRRRAPVLVLRLLVRQKLQGVNSLFSEFLIDFDICPPVIRVKGGSVGHRVEKRPEGAVTAAIVVAVKEFRLRMDGYDLQTTLLTLIVLTFILVQE